MLIPLMVMVEMTDEQALAYCGAREVDPAAIRERLRGHVASALRLSRLSVEDGCADSVRVELGEGRRIDAPVRYRHLGVGDLAAMFCVKPNTVTNWLYRRYTDGDSAEKVNAAPFPQPDVVIGLEGPGTAGWHPCREQEIRDWHKSRPGQGAGGGRRKNPA